MTKIRIVVLLVGAIALILLIFALQLLVPGDQIDQMGLGDARIIFSADRAIVFASGGCVTLRWQVDHIQAVYIQEQPTVGAGLQNLCVTQTTQPLLHVVFNDGSASDYALQIRFLVEQPSTWFLASAALLLALVSLYVALSRPSAPAERQSVSRTMRVFAGIGLVVSVVAVPGA